MGINRPEVDSEQDDKIFSLGTKDKHHAKLGTVTTDAADESQFVSVSEGKVGGNLADTLSQRNEINKVFAQDKTDNRKINLGIGDATIDQADLEELVDLRDDRKQMHGETMTLVDVTPEQHDQLRKSGFLTNGATAILRGDKTRQDLSAVQEETLDQAA